MIAGLFKRWREARAEAAAKRVHLQSLFESFLLETQPLVPRAPKHREAALYRHAWKRAAVLEVLHQRRSDQSRTSLFREFQKLAAERYYRVAPVGPYGPITLRMETKAATLLLEVEIQRLSPTRRKQLLSRPLACIYIGKCEEGRVYVGQTAEAPERRWIQHRAEGTGPFKKETQYVEWKVVEGTVAPAKLNERESYCIGLYDAYEKGYNDTRGNDWKAYERGPAERQRRLST